MSLYRLITMQAQGDNYLTSTVPPSWLRAGMLPKLHLLGLALNQLVGIIPESEPGCGLCASFVRGIARAMDRPELSVADLR